MGIEVEMTGLLTRGDQARVLHLLANVIKYEAVLGSNLLRLVLLLDFVGHTNGGFNS